jgi:hypothetical protein
VLASFAADRVNRPGQLLGLLPHLARFGEFIKFSEISKEVVGLVNRSGL